MRWTPGQHKELEEPNQQLVQMLSSCTSPPLLQTLGTKEQEINLSLYLCYSENVEKSLYMCRMSSCNVCVWLQRKKKKERKRAIIDLFVLSLVELFCFSWKSSSLPKGVNICCVNHHPTWMLLWQYFSSLLWCHLSFIVTVKCFWFVSLQRRKSRRCILKKSIISGGPGCF